MTTEQTPLKPCDQDEVKKNCQIWVCDFKLIYSFIWNSYTIWEENALLQVMPIQIQYEGRVSFHNGVLVVQQRYSLHFYRHSLLSCMKAERDL